MVPVPRELGMNTNGVEYKAHNPVMGQEVLNLLKNLPPGIVIDSTYGSGAHFNLIKSQYSKFKLFGLDRDNDAVLSSNNHNYVFKYNFSELDKFIKDKEIENVKCILFDFGVSTHQLMTEDRGFSFQYDSILDMRMDLEQSYSAKEFINSASKDELNLVLRNYGEEPHAKRIVERIYESRPVESSKQLSELIGKAVPSSNPLMKKKSIRRCFQAIRIHVNNELDHINEGVLKSIKLVDSGGVVIAISYHSLEDRLVKKIFHEYSLDCICPREVPKCVCNVIPLLKLGKPKKIKPKQIEINKNRKSKSAVLRYAIKL